MSETSEGDCFETAAHILLQMGKATNARVVHGICVGQGPIEGKTFKHAWVEVGDLVLDFSNGLRVAMPREQYYKIGRVSKTVKYTRHMIRELMVAYQHYGPWEDLGPTDTDNYKPAPIQSSEVS